jgi:hypothetical protein
MIGSSVSRKLIPGTVAAAMRWHGSRPSGRLRAIPERPLFSKERKMRFLKMSVLGSFLVAALSGVSWAEEHAFRPGQYELKTQVKLEGIDRDIPATTITHCYTADDVKDFRKMAQDPQGHNRDCTTADIKESGRHVSWSTSCKGGAKGTGEMMFTADGYEMTMNMETEGGDHGPMKMKIHTEAKRVGDCSK